MKTNSISRIASLFRRAALALALPLAMVPAQASFVQGADMFNSAPAIVVTNDQSVPFEQSTATAENGEPAILGVIPARSVWWKWTAPANGFVIIETVDVVDFLGSDLTVDPFLAAYTGTSVNSLTTVAQNADFRSFFASRITFATTAGQEYRIKLDANTTLTVGRAQISLRFFERGARSYKGVVFLNYEKGGQAFVSLSLTAAGTYTGKIQSGGKTYPFSGAVSADARIVLGMPGAPVEKPVLLEIDLAQFNGNLPMVLHDGTSVASTVLYPSRVFTKAQPAPVAGYYTGYVETNRNGFYTARVSPTGSVKIVGKTGDGAPFTAGGSLTATQNPVQFNIPFQSMMFAGKGFLIGGLRFTDAAVNGIDSSVFTNRYFRPASTGVFLPAGVKAVVSMPGAQYTPPVAGQRAAGFLNGTNGAGVFAVTAAGAEIGAFAESITFTPSNAFVFTSLTRKPALKLNPKTGLVTGSIREPAGVPRKLTGVLMSNGPLSLRGFVSGATTTANFEVKP